MRYLVTGGAGFIGSHLVERLVRDGAEVTVFDDLSTGRRENLRAVRDRIRFVRGSVARLDACRRAMAGVDFVLHHAAVTSVPQSTRNPLAANQVNVTGTLNILLAAREAHVRRVVFAGSTAAYGDAAELPTHEELLPSPLSAYAATKLAGEAYCQAFWRTHGLETVVLRYFNIFGPRQNVASQYGAVVPLFIYAALQAEPPLIFGDGEQTRDFTFVADAVGATISAATHGAPGRVYNIGGGSRVSVNEVLEMIGRVSGKRLQLVVDLVQKGDMRHTYADTSLARAELGYQPAVGLEQGLAAEFRWLSEAIAT